MHTNQAPVSRREQSSVWSGCRVQSAPCRSLALLPLFFSAAPGLRPLRSNATSSW
uniref:Uncharacterized protein n=1 Tax=Aegilops tauschii subsp. strangulata TaxID=200361 RepID=A0A453KE17_AEGTS